MMEAGRIISDMESLSVPITMITRIATNANV